jgi:glycosyltransferase involved in cell wall biosynthesis
MNVLITCTNLAHGGAQSVARSLAHALRSLGHSVMVYSNEPARGEPALENPARVALDLENLPFRPDIIHGQHHLDAMTTLTALPGVPAIYHSHGAIWKDCVVKHPRIYRYLAVARTAAHRIAIESNISPGNIDVLLNSVDLSRFTEVRTLPAQARRVLFFNRHHHADSETVSAVREAVAKCGLELDCIGYYFGGLTDAPERVLPCYDIVFASGLSAIEALACGCAVIVLGRTSCGEMVQPENFDRFREVNFSLPNNSPPPAPAKIEAELSRYSPQACAAVTERLRDEADFGKSIAKLVGIYERVIEQHRSRPSDLRAESLAVSRYLRRIVPLVRKADEMVGGLAVGALDEST